MNYCNFASVVTGTRRKSFYSSGSSSDEMDSHNLIAFGGAKHKSKARYKAKKLSAANIEEDKCEAEGLMNQLNEAH